MLLQVAEGRSVQRHEWSEARGGRSPLAAGCLGCLGAGGAGSISALEAESRWRASEELASPDPHPWKNPLAWRGGRCLQNLGTDAATEEMNFWYPRRVTAGELRYRGNRWRSGRCRETETGEHGRWPAC